MELERCRICKRTLKSDTIKIKSTYAVKSLVYASVFRKDGLFNDIDVSANLTLHVKCRAIYTRLYRLAGATASVEKTGLTSSSQKRTLCEKSQTARGKKKETVPPWTPPAPHQVFNFQKHCFFCTRDASDDFIKKEKKNTLKKRVIVHKVEKKETKETIVKWSLIHDDTWRKEVRERIESVDLASLNARYHRECNRIFIERATATAQKKSIGRPRKATVYDERESADAKDADHIKIRSADAKDAEHIKLRSADAKDAKHIELASTDAKDASDSDSDFYW